MTNFFTTHALPQQQLAQATEEALHGFEDGELFLEHHVSESLVLDDGVVKTMSKDTSCGFGLRGVVGEQSAYAHASQIDVPMLQQAADTIAPLKNGYDGGKAQSVKLSSRAPLYAQTPEAWPLLEARVALLQNIDAYVRGKEPLTKQVSVSLYVEEQQVHIMRITGEEMGDVRPLVRLNISVVLERDGRMERGSYGSGGRYDVSALMEELRWKQGADEALRAARVNLESIAAPAGEMEVVLGAGWPGVLLHEAVGHGLEGDFNRKGTSAFAGLMGQQVAAKGVTVVDNGTIADRRGSINIDDEGTESGNTTLIEDGILTGYMFDRQNARLMGTESTGNGRRESYEYQPMPRMTNTYMLEGNSSQEEMIANVKKGVFAANFGGGQVDITNGKFVFSATEAYLIEDGKITAPIKGATLMGNGPDCLTKIKAVGNDLKLDEGVGTCGKDGQSVPVGVGQPSLHLSSLTVGGTEG